jgi:hypothetical protein
MKISLKLLREINSLHRKIIKLRRQKKKLFRKKKLSMKEGKMLKWYMKLADSHVITEQDSLMAETTMTLTMKRPSLKKKRK